MITTLNHSKKYDKLRDFYVSEIDDFVRRCSGTNAAIAKAGIQIPSSVNLKMSKMDSVKRIYDKIKDFKDFKTEPFYTVKEILEKFDCDGWILPKLAIQGKIKRTQAGKYSAESVDSYFAENGKFTQGRGIPGRPKVYNLSDVIDSLKANIKNGDTYKETIDKFGFTYKSMLKYLNRNGIGLKQIRKEVK